MPRSRLRSLAWLCAALLAITAAIGAADWPTWRCDERRSAATDEELPATLHLQWVRREPPPSPAWPDDPRVRFDAAPEPVAAGGLGFVGSSRTDSVVAFDLATGAEVWRFYADGPVRFAPTVWRGKAYFASDDGHLYCLDARSGSLRWKFRGGPADRKVVGNERLISTWPARGGPVIADGKVYFAAGIWPFMGVFIYALDAETGKVLWVNDETGSVYIRQPHDSPAFAGLAPQGYLVVAGDRLLVPNGRAIAAALDRRTGKLIYFDHAVNKRNGFCEVAATSRAFANGGMLFDLETGLAIDKIGLAGIPTRTVAYKAQNSSLVVVDKLTGETLCPIGPVGVLTEGASYQFNGTAIVAMDVGNLAAETYIDRGVTKKRWQRLQMLWKLPTQARPMAKAGGRLYAATSGEIVAIDLPARRAGLDLLNGVVTARDPVPQPKVAWRMKVEGTPASMAVADGRLLVSTEQGAIYCYGEKAVPSPPTISAADPPPAGPNGAGVGPGALAAEQLLKAAGVADGYCLVLGLRDGRLAEQLALRPGLRVIAIDADAGKVDALRRRWDAAGLYGERIAALAADPAAVSLPPYLASLIVSEEPSAILGSTPNGGAAREAVEHLFRALRPYGGTLCLDLAAGPRARQTASGGRDARAAFARAAGESPVLNGARPREDGPFTLLSRPGPLPGAGSWTGQYGDPGNTGVSQDDLVRLPLGLLWFGGASSAKVLPRHGHGPPEQVLGGRLFIEGPDMLRALDVYTGRLLWEANLPGVGRNYDYTTHEPGANALGTNYVVTPDCIYVAYARRCLRLDPATGRTLGQFVLPGNLLPDGQGRNGKEPVWGYINVWKDVLVAGSTPLRFWEPDFAHDEFTSPVDKSGKRTGPYSKTALAVLADAIEAWRDFPLERPRTAVVFPSDTQPTTRPGVAPAGDLDFIVANLNKMLRQKDVLSKLPGSVLAAARAAEKARREAPPKDFRKETGRGDAKEEMDDDDDEGGDLNEDSIDDVAEKIRSHLAQPGTGGPDDQRLRTLNRALLKLVYPRLPEHSRPRFGQFNMDGSSSAELVAMDRHSGAVLWRRAASSAFRHNAIALGDGKVFCIDRTPLFIVQRMLRRGQQPQDASTLLALDIRTGRVVWQRQQDVFGTWLSYSSEHDVLLQAGRPSRDALRDEPSGRLIAHRGANGEVIWDRAHKYEGPCLLHGDAVITQGAALDLLTGKTRNRINPLTGKETPWKYIRQHGCSTAIASRHLLTFRSAAAGFYDLAGDSGTGNFGGFKSGCTANLIAADGVLNAPDYTFTCTCSYQNQSSLALVHDPEAEVWTYQEYSRDHSPGTIRAMGINFGAPGDRLGDNGTLWLEYPFVGGPSPKPKIAIEPNEPFKPSILRPYEAAVAPRPADPDLPTCFRRHSSAVRGAGGLNWVAASGIEGATRIRIALSDPKGKPKSYTVSLHFAEPVDLRPGDRVFTVGLQGTDVLPEFDVVGEAGGPLKPVVKTFQGVQVKGDLEISLTPSNSCRLARPILCGVEVRLEDTTAAKANLPAGSETRRPGQG